MDRGQIGPGEVLCWRTPGLAESFFLGDMRPCRRKPFFLGDMMLQRENRNENRFCNAWRLGSTIPFFFFWQLASSMLLWRLGSTIPFFFFGSCHLTLSHWAFMAQWPDGVWKKTPGLFFFWFLGQCPSQCVQTKKKTKIKKKAAKKKSCYINIKKKKSPFPFFLYGL